MSGSLAAAVRDGLVARPKRLPAWLFYDAEGSRLFEEITALPEYYLTRTERSIFVEHARQIVRAAGTNLTLVELGAGSAAKTHVIIEALLREQGRALYAPVDVSATALQLARTSLEDAFPHGLSVLPMLGHYTSALMRMRGLPGRKLVLFIGSSIGNYDPKEGAELLRDVQRALEPGDVLLLGTDLHKDESLLVPAYDDAAGVTARFNKNMLARINRELGGHFDLSRFHHVAVWNERASRMEMHLESTVAQDVRIDGLDLTVHFDRGERLHTECSYKFTFEMVDTMLEYAGFRREHTFTDPHGWFGVHLARVEPTLHLPLQPPSQPSA